MRQFLTFQLGGVIHGVDADFVNSILDLQSWEPLPSFGTAVKGLVNVRGNVVPLVDPEKLLEGARFDLPDSDGKSAILEDGGLIIFEVANGTRLPYICMEVDRIGRVMVLEDERILPVPPNLPERVSSLYEGFCLEGDFGFSVLRLAELVSRDRLFGQRVTHG